MGKWNQNEEAEHNIFELFNQNSFVKVKQAFEIDKILFSFVETDGSKKLTNNIDCYMSIPDAAMLAEKIMDGRVFKAIDAGKKKAAEQGKQYADDIWQSTLGGVSEETAKAKNLRNDGKAISRCFTIAPGSRKYAVITARQRAGSTDERGLIVPDVNDKGISIRVAVAGYDDLQKLAVMLRAAVNCYMQYSISADMRLANERRSARRAG